MPRVKRSVASRKKRRKVLGQAKGYWGLKKSSYRYAKEQVDHSLTYAYRDRKNKKRTFRRLWIMRINAGARANGLSYNQFIAGLRKAEVEIQTNEVQRAWALLPCLLELARWSEVPVFDLVELGTSAGLLLLWDRYQYRYAAGEWGPNSAALELAGEERGRVPGELLRVVPRARRRVGIDRNPLDLRDPADLLLLKSFVWAGQDDRLARLDAAAEALRDDPPELVRGDLVELLPAELARRDDGALMIVLNSAAL